MAAVEDAAATGRPRGRPGSPTHPASPGQEWVSWEQAAVFVGCPVSTIDWHTRTGRIESRPRQSTRPTVATSSLLEFKDWWTARERWRAETSRQRAARRERRSRTIARARARAEGKATDAPTAPPAEGRWLSLDEAAEKLGCTPSTVVRRISDGLLTGVRRGTRLWVEANSLTRLAVQEHRWISAAGAAALVGCSTHAIWTAVEKGLIGQRATTSRAVPSLDRASVEQFKATRARAAQQRRQARVAAVAQAARRQQDLEPPQDGQVWLDTRTVALMLGVTRGRVRQLAARDRLPHHRSQAGRLWFRRDHIELTVAARRQRA